MLKMCQAIANLEITVECVLPGRVKKERLFSYYGIKTPFVLPLLLFLAEWLGDRYTDC